MTSTEWDWPFTVRVYLLIGSKVLRRWVSVTSLLYSTAWRALSKEDGDLVGSPTRARFANTTSRDHSLPQLEGAVSTFDERDDCREPRPGDLDVEIEHSEHSLYFRHIGMLDAKIR